MTSIIHPLLIVSLLLGLNAVLHAEGSDDATVDITESYSYDDDGSYYLDGFFVAKRSDYDACLDWQPTDPDQKLPLNQIIEVAMKHVEKPKRSDGLRYLPPELRGVDFRNLAYPNDLWFWQVHFAFSIDRESDKTITIRGGEILNSVRVLPNGGMIWLRAATAEEVEDFERRKRVSSESDPFQIEAETSQDTEKQSSAGDDDSGVE